MIIRIFCVRDRATDSYGNPMFLLSEGQAIRSFSDEINRNASDNQLFQHPDDFDLYRLGTFDTDIGSFEVYLPAMVVTGKSVKVRS